METIDTRFVSECTTYDFKRELDRKKKNSWLKSVSAFANTNGGSLYFGVDNDGQVIGLADVQSDTEFISEAINAYLDPIPVFSINPQKGRNGKIFLDLNVAAVGRLRIMSIPTVVRWLISVPAMKAFLPLLISCSIWC